MNKEREKSFSCKGIIKRTGGALLLAGSLMILLTLAACGGGAEKASKEKAEAYLSTLAAKTDIADRFSLGSVIKAEERIAGEPTGFRVRSEHFGQDFTVYVSEDGKTVTDTYYSLSLKEKAQKKIETLFQSALEKDPPSENILGPEVRFKDLPLTALSARSFSDLKQFCEAAGALSPLEVMIKEKTPGRDQLTENQINLLMLEMQKQGISGSLYPYASSAVWFEITADKIWKNTRSGADGGAMMQREEYRPTVKP